MDQNIEIGIKPENRKAVAELLNKLLADEYVLNVKTKNYHWNIVDIHFHSLHKFLDELYEKGNEYIDEIAERVRMFGEKPLGTMNEFLKEKTLQEHDGPTPEAKKMLENLLKDHELIIRNLRENAQKCADELEDDGTNDFLIGLLQEHEKTAWMLRSHLI